MLKRILYLVILISCNTAKKFPTQEISKGKSSSKVFKPINIKYVNPLPDTMAQYFEKCFNEKDIKTLTSKEAIEKIKTFYFNNSNDIKKDYAKGSMPSVKNSITTKGYILNALNIEMLPPANNEAHVNLKWKNQPLPEIADKMINKWQTIDIKQSETLTWKQVLKAITDSIVQSKLLY